MQQVLLGLAALAIAMTLALNSRATTRESEESANGVQLELMAANVLGEAFTEASLLPYDAEADAETLPELTPSADFGGAGWDAAADLDDLHGATATRTRLVEGQTVTFTLVASVSYVQKSGGGYVARSTPQTFKRLELVVSGPMGVTARSRRTFAWHGLGGGA